MDRRWWALVTVAALCFLMGCTGVLPSAESPTDSTPTVSETPSSTSTPMPTVEPTPTSVPVAAENPYGKRTLTVGLAGDGNGTVNRTSPILAALAYWESNATEYVGYNVSFRYSPTTRTPDITIQFVDEISVCGLEDETNTQVLGCATVPGDTVSIPLEIRVLSGYTNASTERILEHELGHALGLSHGDEPAAIMRESIAVAPLTLEYTYTVEDETSRHHPGQVNEQLSGMEQFLEAGGGGTIASDVSIEEVEQRDDADLVVVLTDDDDACPRDRVICTSGGWTCLHNNSCRADGGPTMTLERIQTEAIGWVIGQKLFTAILIDGGAVEWPVEFDPEETDPTDTWWV